MRFKKQSSFWIIALKIKIISTLQDKGSDFADVIASNLMIIKRFDDFDFRPTFSEKNQIQFFHVFF